jgi:putative peptidoglycan lipid II flippase
LLASAALAAVSYGVWDVLDSELGRGTGAQIISLGAALGAGALIYALAILALRVPEGRQVMNLVRRR